jgi:hypothetical protein
MCFLCSSSDSVKKVKDITKLLEDGLLPDGLSEDKQHLLFLSLSSALYVALCLAVCGQRTQVFSDELMIHHIIEVEVKLPQTDGTPPSTAKLVCLNMNQVQFTSSHT